MIKRYSIIKLILYKIKKIIKNYLHNKYKLKKKKKKKKKKNFFQKKKKKKKKKKKGIS